MNNSTATAAPRYLNEHLGSDVLPFEVVRVISEKTVEIRGMKAERDPSWKPESVVGGFSRVVLNNESQRWIITSNPAAPVFRARRCKNGRWSVAGHARFMPSDRPVCFYDYNF